MSNNSKTAIPDWLLVNDKNYHTSKSKNSMHFIKKTLSDISQVFENEFFCEKYAGRKMLLQMIDPRIKLLTIIFYLVLSSFTSNIILLLVLALIPMLYAKLSGLNMRDYLRRVWLYVPLIVLILSLPAASSLFVNGKVLFYLIKPNDVFIKNGIYFSLNGIEVALRLFLRSGISLSFCFLLLLTTRWSHITNSLAIMRVPLVFISILNMAYRYIFVISNAAEDMLTARFLRTIGELKTKENRKFMGNSIAHLFLKSHFLSEEVFDAMRCRGFTDKPVCLKTFKITNADVIFILNNCSVVFLLLVGEKIF